MGYSLNTDAARQGDQISSRISETGAYVGRFTRAEAVSSDKGTKGVEMSFEANDKASADFLTLWLVNGEGKEIWGHKQLMALMTCLRVKTINEQDALIEKFVNGQKQKVKAIVYPELMDKPIGVLLQREEYQKRDGSIGHKFNLFGFFDPQTNLTASEILDKTTKPEKLERMKAALKDKPMQKRVAANEPAMSGPAPAGYDDEDLPF